MQSANMPSQAGCWQLLRRSKLLRQDKSAERVTTASMAVPQTTQPGLMLLKELALTSLS